MPVPFMNLSTGKVSVVTCDTIEQFYEELFPDGVFNGEALDIITCRKTPYDPIFAVIVCCVHDRNKENPSVLSKYIKISDNVLTDIIKEFNKKYPDFSGDINDIVNGYIRELGR